MQQKIKLLVNYTTYEITNEAMRSIPRLLASVIAYLENYADITFFTFDKNYNDPVINTKPIYISITKQERIYKRVRKMFFQKGFGNSEFKRFLVDKYLSKQGEQYQFIISPRLPDLEKLKTMFPDSEVLLWFHDLTILDRPDMKMNINFADHIITPSITSYYRIQRFVEPHSLTSQWHYIGNWASDIFSTPGIEIVSSLKTKYNISPGTKIFIFSGGDLKFKGGHIIKAAFREIASELKNDTILFYAGQSSKDAEINFGKLRIISTGNLLPGELAAHYSLAQFGLFPSLGYDHSPLTLLEMIHAGVLPLASDVGGIWEILGKDYTFLVDFPNSVPAWSALIMKALELSETARANIVAGLEEKIATTHDSKINRERFKDIISSKS